MLVDDVCKIFLYISFHGQHQLRCAINENPELAAYVYENCDKLFDMCVTMSGDHREDLLYNTADANGITYEGYMRQIDRHSCSIYQLNYAIAELLCCAASKYTLPDDKYEYLLYDICSNERYYASTNYYKRLDEIQEAIAKSSKTPEKYLNKIIRFCNDKKKVYAIMNKKLRTLNFTDKERTFAFECIDSRIFTVDPKEISDNTKKIIASIIEDALKQVKQYFKEYKDYVRPILEHCNTSIDFNKNAFENALKVAEKKSTTYTNFEIIYLINKELAKTNEYKHTIAEKEYDKNRESVADAVLSGKTEMKEENKNTYERNVKVENVFDYDR